MNTGSVRVLLALAGLLCVGARQEETLDSVLEGMEKRAAAVRDLRARFVYTVHEKETRSQELRSRVLNTGSLLLRAGDAAWAGAEFAAWLDGKKGYRAALDSKGLVLHAPPDLVPPEDWAGQSDPAHHGASYFRSRLETSPHTVPLLAEQPWLHPVTVFYDLAPKRFIAALPGLKLLGKKEKDGRAWQVLTAERTDGSEAARVAEAQGGLHESWLGCDIWVDAADYTVGRVLFRYEASASGPPHRREKEYVFARREEFGGVRGVPTLVTWGTSELSLFDVQVNAGVKEEEVRVPVPEGRIARDWNRLDPASYRKVLEKTPDDPALWLSLGSVLLRHQDWKGAADAFQKVIDLRPDAEEGYIGMAYLFNEEPTLQTATEAVEKGAARVRSPLVHLALAHRYSKQGSPECGRHFEEALKIAGEDPRLLEKMLQTVQFDDPWPPTLRALRAELRTGEEIYVYDRWSRTPHEAAPHLEFLAKLYEEAFQDRKAPEWIRARLIDLYRGMKRPADAQRHARAALERFEDSAAGTFWRSYPESLETFLAEKDFDRAHRVRWVVARGDGREARSAAARLEARIIAFQGTPSGLLEYWDECIRPEWNEGEKYSWSPRCGPFLWGLRDSGRVIPFAEALLEQVGPEPEPQAAADLVELISKEHAFGTDWARLDGRLKEIRSGKPATAQNVLQVCNQFVADRKWKEGLTRVNEALKRADLTPVQRVYAGLLQARCFEGLGDSAGALAACERVLEAPGLYRRSRREAWTLRGRLFLAQGDGKHAALAYASALREAVEPRDFDGVREVLEMVRRGTVIVLGDGTGDDPALRAVFGLTVRDSEKAADALADACRAWAADPWLLRESVRASAGALRVEEALAARGRLDAVLATLQAGRTILPYRSEATLDIATALDRLGDTAKMKAFVESMIAEPRWSDSYSSILHLLEAIGDEAYLEKSQRALLDVSKNETDRFNSRHLTARAYHALGNTEKATAILAGITEKQGWEPSSAETARREIGLMGVEAKGRATLLAAWRTRLSDLKEGDDEVEVLGQLAREGERRREVWSLAALWRAALREERPDPFLLKVGALRSSERREQLACVEKLETLGPVRPEWRLRRIFLLLDQADDPKALEVLKGMIRASAGDPGRRDGMARLLAGSRWRLSGPAKLELGRALSAEGAHRGAWELMREALEDLQEVLSYALKWRGAAEAGEERAEAGLVIAQTLLRLERAPEALAELEAAAAEPEISRVTRAQIGPLHLKLLARIGHLPDLTEALLRWLRTNRFSPEEVEGAVRTVSTAKVGVGEFLKEWEKAARGEPASAGLAVFRARLHSRAGLPREALEILEEGGRQFPGEPRLLRDLGAARYSANDFKGAAEAFEGFLARDSGAGDDGSIHTLLARCYGKTGRAAEALERLRALRDDSVWSEVLAGIAEEIGLHDEAVRFYRAALERRTDSYLRYRLVRALGAAGRVAEADVELRTLMDSEAALGLAATRDLLKVLPVEKAALLILERIRAAKDLRSALMAFESLVWDLPAASRGNLGGAWEKATGGALEDERVVMVASRVWQSSSDRTRGKALEVLLAASRKLPASVPIHFEALQLLVQAGRRGEAAAIHEKLAILDPEGKETRLTSAQHLLHAYSGYLEEKDSVAALRVGMECLAMGGVPGNEASWLRGSLAGVARGLGDGRWWEMARLKLKPPAGRRAVEISTQVELLSDDDIERRRVAVDALKEIGPAALPALVPLVESGDLDLRTEARKVVSAILGD